MATNTLIATQVIGQAWIREADGSLRPIYQGMQIPADANIVTAEGATVQLQADGIPPLTIGSGRSVRAGADLAQPNVDPATNAAAPVDSEAAQVLAALQAGEDPFDVLDPTAAVLTGGADGAGGSSFTRLLSIVETTTPLGLEYPRPAIPATEDVRLGGASVAADDADVPLPGLPTIDIPPAPDVPGTAPQTTFVIREDNVRGDDDHGGNDPNQPALFAALNIDGPSGYSGFFSFTAPAGLQSLNFTFDAEPQPGESGSTRMTLSVSQAGLLQISASNPLEIDTGRGLLHLTSYDPATGTIGYTYWSDGAQYHDIEAGNDDSVFDTIQITVVDALGRSVSGQLVANITDTEPVAEDDWGGVVQEDHDDKVLGGNVLDNDDVYDHSVTDPASVQWDDDANAEMIEHLSRYGTIELNGDGSWKFTLNNGLPAVDALAQGQTVKIALQYVAVDNDGDPSEPAILKFVIRGTNDGPIVETEGSALGVAVSEEALVHLGGLLEGDDDEVDVKKDTGVIVFTDPDSGDTHTARFVKPAGGELTSDGHPVMWNLANNQTLEGFITVEGEKIPIIILEIDGREGADGSYQFPYTVTLKGPIDHPVSPGSDGHPDNVPGVEDDWSFDVTVVISDSQGVEATTAVTVTVHDDSPRATDSDSVTVTESSVDILLGSFSFAGNGAHQASQYEFTDANGNRLAVTALGFKSATEAELVDADVGQNANGIGVASQESPYHNIDAEVDFRIFPDDQGGLSEQLIIDLQDGMVAYGAKITFAAMFGKEAEVGEAFFYKQDDSAPGGYRLVHSKVFTSDQASGNYAADFAEISTAFDRIVLVALDNFQNEANDNSDFTVAGIEFYGASAEHVIATATGNLGAQYGADGKGTNGGIVVEELVNGTSMVTESGKAIASIGANADGVFEGRDEDGNLVFQVYLSELTGDWELLQFQKFGYPDGEDPTELRFKYKITDADGDIDVGHFGVLPLASVLNIEPTVDPDRVKVKESALVDVESDDGITATGSLNVVDDNPANLVYEFGLPDTPGLVSDGAPIVWSYGDSGQKDVLWGKAGDDAIIKITIDANGDYIVTMLGPVDHPDPETHTKHDSVSFDVPVTVLDGDDHVVPTAFKVIVKDGHPSTEIVEPADSITVPVSEVIISGLEGGFENAVDTKDQKVDGWSTDDDAYREVIRWGSGSNWSSYTYYDENFNGTGPLTDTTFKLGTFTHHNYTISGNDATLKTTDLVVAFYINIDGAPHWIEHRIKLEHDETPNTGTPEQNRDIVTIDADTLEKTFTVGDREYKFRIAGFEDADGQHVSKIYTYEGLSNTFDLFATIESVESLPTTSGKLAWDYGTDGPGQIVWEEPDGVTATSETDGTVVITSADGTLTVNTDGSYTFEISRKAYDNFGVGEAREVKFDYTVIDNDGDRAPGSVVININGVQNAPAEPETDDMPTVTGNDPDDIAATGLAVQTTDDPASTGSLVQGSDGDDVLIGGPGDDTLTGGPGDDVFKWQAGDAGIPGAPARDIITDFGLNDTDSRGNDMLDLADLLQGEQAEFTNGQLTGSLGKYLHFAMDGDDTVISISTAGEFTGEESSSPDPDKVDQVIVLAGVSVEDLAGSAAPSQNDIINNLINQGKLNVDQS